MIDRNKLDNIHKLSVDDCLLIMRECAERIGLADVDDYVSACGGSKRDVYYKIKSGKIRYFPVGKRKFPCINN